MKANRPSSREELSAQIHENVDEVLAMLTAKGATETDLAAFKGMLYHVAESVANASKEGGFLGFGGQLVSEREQSVLEQIQMELGV
jgi:hypothetical protein